MNSLERQLIAGNQNFEKRTLQEDIIVIEMKEIEKLIAEKTEEFGVNYIVALDVRYVSDFLGGQEYGHFIVSIRLNGYYSLYFDIDGTLRRPFAIERSITEGVNKIYDIIKSNYKEGKQFYILEINE